MGQPCISGPGQTGEKVHWLKGLDTLPSPPGKGCLIPGPYVPSKVILGLKIVVCGGKGPEMPMFIFIQVIAPHQMRSRIMCSQNRGSQQVSPKGWCAWQWCKLKNPPQTPEIEFLWVGPRHLQLKWVPWVILKFNTIWEPLPTQWVPFPQELAMNFQQRLEVEECLLWGSIWQAPQPRWHSGFERGTENWEWPLRRGNYAVLREGVLGYLP